MSANDSTNRMHSQSPDSHRQDWILWIVALAPPLAWAVRFMIVYPLVHVACQTDSLLSINLVSLVAIVITIISGVVAWRTWQRLTGGDRAFIDGPRSRPEFMAFSGVLFSAFFLALILLEWSPVLFINPCVAGL